MLRGIGVLFVLGLTLYALIDCARADSDEIKGLPKVLWVLIIVLVPPIGALAWILAGRNRNPRPRPAPRHPTAPDDDPEFLRRLAEQRRQQAEDERLRRWEAELRDREQGKGGDDDSSGAAR